MKLKGIPASLGPKIEGRARVIKSNKDIYLVEKGEIIIIRGADMDLTILFNKISGIITEEGGVMQHTAILAREFNIPCLVAVPGIVDLVETGLVINFDVQNREISFKK